MPIDLRLLGDEGKALFREWKNKVEKHNKYTVKNNDALKEQIYSKSDLELFGIKKIDVMEENILMLVLSEYKLDQTPKNILIDEAVRLSKKFGADNAYKFINATLDTLLK